MILDVTREPPRETRDSSDGESAANSSGYSAATERIMAQYPGLKE